MLKWLKAGFAGRGRVRIILADWGGYPLYREKRFAFRTLECGLGPLLAGLSHYDAGVPFELFLVINEPLPEHQTVYKQLQERYSFIRGVFFRDNTGFDFGAYNFGYQKLKEENYCGDLVLMNSSLGGPSGSGWLKEYRSLFYKAPRTGLCGITLNSQSPHENDFKPHLQSFFIYTHMAVLKKVFPGDLPGASLSGDRLRLVFDGEIKLSQKMLECGYGIRARAFPDFFYRKDSFWSIPQGDLRNQPEYHHYANTL